LLAQSITASFVIKKKLHNRKHYLWADNKRRSFEQIRGQLLLAPLLLLLPLQEIIAIAATARSGK
jgi:hypothetical protein